MIDYLYSEIGNPISIGRISDELGIGASTATDYLELITDSMLFRKVERYDLKGKGVLTQEPKYYCTDTGMRYAQPIGQGRDLGKVLENIVYLELIRRGYRVQVGKTEGENDRHLEIDFIVIKEDSNDYYQVTQSLNDPRVYEREIRPLKKISGRGERYIITYDDVPVQKGPDAIVMNITDFLLGDVRSETPVLTDAYNELYAALERYTRICTKISGTVVTSENFDMLAEDLQMDFFDLQALFRRPQMVSDDFMQATLPRITMNNVRIFNAMIACVNANSKPIYKPIMTAEMEELTEIGEAISRHIADTR